MARASKNGHGSFATVFNCMDGRAVLPVIQWAKAKLAVQFVDAITAPGMDLKLAGGANGEAEEYQRCARISIEKHGSRHVLVVGHCDCAGNPVSREEHEQHVKNAVATVRSWGLSAHVSIHGLVLDERWRPVEVLV